MLGQQRRRQWERRRGLLVPAVPAGSYDNLANWPSAVNRPQLSGNDLSWIGPVGGGPSTNADVAQTRTLTNSGLTATTSNGQVIEGLKFSSTFNISHDNVTIRQCALVVNETSTVGFDLTKGSLTGVVIEDCYTNGNKNSFDGVRTKSGCSFVSTNPSFIRRNYMSGWDNHITLWCGGNFNMSIVDNYLTDPGNAGQVSPQWDGDMLEFYQLDHVTVSHNVINGVNRQVAGVLNSLLNVTAVSAITNLTVTGNMFGNAGLCDTFMICDAGSVSDPGTYSTLQWSFTNNGIHAIGSKSYRRTGAALTANSGNYTAATLAATSGTLISGGTGAI